MTKILKINTKEIHIFDIDGCIFPAKNNNGKQIIPNEYGFKEIPAEIILDNMKSIKLFPKFVDFYKLITKSKPIEIYFITGRKKKDYLNITLKQLSILKIKKNKDSLIFFPDEKILTRRSYYEFKLYNTLKIIIKDNSSSKINIYDDKYSYFSVLKNRLNDIEINSINYNKINQPEYFWNLKYNEYKNFS